MNFRILGVWSLLFLSSLLLFSSAEASSCGKMVVMRAAGSGGKMVELVIDSEQLRVAPKWNPSSGESVPLSASEVYKLSTEWIADRHSEIGVDVRRISLTSSGCSSLLGGWYYVVELTPVGGAPYTASDWLAILMDGTIIEPR